MSWKEEDEYIDEESNTGFGEKKSSDGFPVPVAQRMVAYAERTGKNIEEVKQMYLDYIKKEYGVEDYTQEDVDILIDWAEQAFVQTRKQTASTSGTSTWVGCFIGVADRTKD